MTTSRVADAPPASPTDKWEIQLRKGCLELAILACLWQGKLYGLEILRQLETGSDLRLSAGTVYPLLARLKAEGLLKSEWVEAEAGHPRKYYQLMPLGRRRALQMARLWSEFAASLRDLLAPVLKEELDDNRSQRGGNDRFLPRASAREAARLARTRD